MQVAHAGDRAGDLPEPENMGRAGGRGRDDLDRRAVGPSAQNLRKSCADGNIDLPGLQHALKRSLISHICDPHIEAFLFKKALLKPKLGIRAIPRTAIWHSYI